MADEHPAARHSLVVLEDAAEAVGPAVGDVDRLAVGADGDLVGRREVVEDVADVGPVLPCAGAKDIDVLARLAERPVPIVRGPSTEGTPVFWNCRPAVPYS